MSVALRPYQEEGVRRILATPKPHRFALTWEMGCGKSYAAAEVFKRLGIRNFLWVCPANTRRTIRRHINAVWPELNVGVIEYGKTTRLSKRLSSEREAQYLSETQVVSYDLLKEVSPEGWAGIVFDEFDELQNPKSAQSKLARLLAASNPQATILLLSGTPVPKEIKQLWHPLYLAWGDRFGRPWRKGKAAIDYSIEFCNKYCIKEVNQYGTQWYGAQEGAAEKLGREIAPYFYRVTRAEAAEYQPRVTISAEYISDENASSLGSSSLALGIRWAQQTVLSGQAVRGLGLFTHLRESARRVYEDLCRLGLVGTRIYLATGETSTAKRDEILEEIRHDPRAILVGTFHAFLKGVDLSDITQARCLEWTTRPGDLQQFLGRFGRREDAPNAEVTFIVREGTKDEVRLELIQRRMETINRLSSPGATEHALGEALKPREISEEDFFARMRALVENSTGRDSINGDLEDDEEDLLNA